MHIQPTLNLKMPKVMGILNVTPDSFCAVGHYFQNVDAALRHAQQMVQDGAYIIDVGGESTRPYAEPVSVQEELDRVIPVIERIHKELPVLISVDSSQPQVFAAAVNAGAGFINDTRALTVPGALEQAAKLNVHVCLMHMQNNPQTMQESPTYQDVVAEVSSFLADRIQACIQAGISRDRIVVDPGFGFGKTDQQNFTLQRELAKLRGLGCPILVGWSRKSTIGRVLNLPVNERLAASLALATLAVAQGASIIRAHDVKETVHAVKITSLALGNV